LISKGKDSNIADIKNLDEEEEIIVLYVRVMENYLKQKNLDY
jgi:hypothetical protein